MTLRTLTACHNRRVTNPDRRSGLDSSFLHLGGGSARRHVAGCTVFAGAPTSYHELLAHVQYSGVDIATVLFHASPESVPVAPPEHEWVPRPVPSSARLLAAEVGAPIANGRGGRPDGAGRRVIRVAE